jgi:hypothetical protein
MRRTSKNALTVQLKIQLDAVLLSICYFMQHDRRVAHPSASRQTWGAPF